MTFLNGLINISIKKNVMEGEIMLQFDDRQAKQFNSFLAGGDLYRLMSPTFANILDPDQDR